MFRILQHERVEFERYNCRFFQVDRDRTQLLVQTMKELNTQYNLYNRRASNTPPLAVNRIKVTFKDEPGEGSGVARSFYTAIAEVSPVEKVNIIIG